MWGVIIKMTHRKENCFYRRCPERKHNVRGEPTCLYRVGLTWCHSPKYKDKWLAALHSNLTDIMIRRRNSGPAAFECPYCGKIWKGTAGNIRRMSAPLGLHIRACETKTPTKRRLANHRAAAKRRRQMSRGVEVIENPDHPGLQG